MSVNPVTALTITNSSALIVQGGTLDVGNTYGVANLMVSNGLVLNGAALAGDPTPANHTL